ncbi:hypothetical protein ACNKHP_04360 [Shigella boydii]
MTSSSNGINRHPHRTTWYGAVADPWPGAFSYVGNQKIHRLVVARFILMPAKHSRERDFIAPLSIACGDGALEIVTGQAGDGITMQGSQLAQTLGLAVGVQPILNSQRAPPLC